MYKRIERIIILPVNECLEKQNKMAVWFNLTFYTEECLASKEIVNELIMIYLFSITKIVFKHKVFI